MVTTTTLTMLVAPKHRRSPAHVAASMDNKEMVTHSKNNICDKAYSSSKNYDPNGKERNDENNKLPLDPLSQQQQQSDEDRRQGDKLQDYETNESLPLLPLLLHEKRTEHFDDLRQARKHQDQDVRDSKRDEQHDKQNSCHSTSLTPPTLSSSLSSHFQGDNLPSSNETHARQSIKQNDISVDCNRSDDNHTHYPYCHHDKDCVAQEEQGKDTTTALSSALGTPNNQSHSTDNDEEGETMDAPPMAPMDSHNESPITRRDMLLAKTPKVQNRKSQPSTTTISNTTSTTTDADSFNNIYRRNNSGYDSDGNNSNDEQGYYNEAPPSPSPRLLCIIRQLQLELQDQEQEYSNRLAQLQSTNDTLQEMCQNYDQQLHAMRIQHDKLRMSSSIAMGQMKTEMDGLQEDKQYLLEKCELLESKVFALHVQLLQQVQEDKQEEEEEEDEEEEM